MALPTDENEAREQNEFFFNIELKCKNCGWIRKEKDHTRAGAPRRGTEVHRNNGISGCIRCGCSKYDVMNEPPAPAPRPGPVGWNFPKKK